jgi:hypothetical protein
MSAATPHERRLDRIGRLHPFGSIESRAGMYESDYQPPEDRAAVIRDENEPGTEWPIWVMACLLPIGGIIWGIVWLARDKVGPGLGLIFTSMLAASVWAVVFAALELV